MKISGSRLINNFSEDKIFIDSNIILYSLLSNIKFSKECNIFLSKIKNSQINGFVSPLVVSEVFYKILLFEISKINNSDINETKLLLKNNPKLFINIKSPYLLIEELLDYQGLKIVEIGETISRKSVLLSNRYQLMPNDAMHVATCQFYDINNIATNDSDFGRVDFLNVWKP